MVLIPFSFWMASNSLNKIKYVVVGGFQCVTKEGILSDENMISERNPSRWWSRHSQWSSLFICLCYYYSREQASDLCVYDFGHGDPFKPTSKCYQITQDTRESKGFKEGLLDLSLNLDKLKSILQQKKIFLHYRFYDHWSFESVIHTWMLIHYFSTWYTMKWQLTLFVTLSYSKVDN